MHHCCNAQLARLALLRPHRMDHRNLGASLGAGSRDPFGSRRAPAVATSPATAVMTSGSWRSSVTTTNTTTTTSSEPSTGKETGSPSTGSWRSSHSGSQRPVPWTETSWYPRGAGLPVQSDDDHCHRTSNTTFRTSDDPNAGNYGNPTSPLYPPGLEPRTPLNSISDAASNPTRNVLQTVPPNNYNSTMNDGANYFYQTLNSQSSGFQVHDSINNNYQIPNTLNNFYQFPNTLNNFYQIPNSLNNFGTANPYNFVAFSPANFPGARFVPNGFFPVTNTSSPIPSNLNSLYANPSNFIGGSANSFLVGKFGGVVPPHYLHGRNYIAVPDMDQSKAELGGGSGGAVVIGPDRDASDNRGRPSIQRYQMSPRAPRKKFKISDDMLTMINDLRQWDFTKSGTRHLRTPKSGVEFTIMSYNVLAQCLLQDNDYLYWHCDERALSWRHRSDQLLREFRQANADILCLQEVQCDHYDNFYVPELRKLGYTGTFKKRTGNKQDGCAVFFKENKFVKDSVTAVEFCHPHIGTDLARDNIALLVTLRPRRAPRRRPGDGSCRASAPGAFCVVNTHLLFNPGRGDIKLAQLRILLAEIDRVAFLEQNQDNDKKTTGSNYRPILLCGDMNSEPHCPLHRFVCTGLLDYEGLTAGDVSGQLEGARKGRFQLSRELIPPVLGISDQCQYVETLKTRGVVKNSADQTQNLARGSPNSVHGSQNSNFSRTNSIAPSSNKKEHCDSSCGNDKMSVAPSTNAKEQRCAASGTNNKVSAVSFTDKKQLDKERGAEGDEDKVEGQLSSSSSTSCSRSPPGDTPVFSTGTMSHGFNLVSAYNHTLDRLDGEQEVTTHHRKSSCTVDYIFYSVLGKETCVRDEKIVHRDVREGQLQLLATYGLLGAGELERFGGLPNQFQPSDHLPLMARFLLSSDDGGH